MALEELRQEHPRLPRFTGSNPNLWISQAEQYFLFYTIYDDERFPYVIESFDDEPFWWFNGWYRGSHSLTWNDFTTAMITQFQATYVDPIATDPCSIHQTKGAVDPIQELALFDSKSTANSIVALSFTSGLIHSVSIAFATTDLKVFDEMLVSIENEIVKEVHETMDDKVLEIQDNDMVENNDCDVDSSAVSVVFQSFAWKPGWVENPVKVSTYPTPLDSPPSFIPPLDEELDHNTLFDFDPGLIHSVLIQQNRHAKDPILALVAPLTPNSSMPSVDVSGAIREGYLDILLSQKLVQVYHVPTFVILSVGTLNLQFDCSAMVIDRLILPFCAKVPRTYFGFDPRLCVFKMPYSDRIIILLNHIGVALVESTASNMDHQCHFAPKLFVVDKTPDSPDPCTNFPSPSIQSEIELTISSMGVLNGPITLFDTELYPGQITLDFGSSILDAPVFSHHLTPRFGVGNISEPQNYYIIVSYRIYGSFKHASEIVVVVESVNLTSMTPFHSSSDDSHMVCHAVIISENESIHQIFSCVDLILPDVDISSVMPGSVLNDAPASPIGSFGSANKVMLTTQNSLLLLPQGLHPSLMPKLVFALDRNDTSAYFLTVPKETVVVPMAFAIMENHSGFVSNPNLLVKSFFHRNIKGDEHSVVFQFQIRDTRLSWKGGTTNLIQLNIAKSLGLALCISKIPTPLLFHDSAKQIQFMLHLLDTGQAREINIQSPNCVHPGFTNVSNQSDQQFDVLSGTSHTGSQKSKGMENYMLCWK
ncbi:hypothetical protein Hdeb2414_s0011g00362291 [Helianthus debilis subsp. tardiflorus]